MKIFLFLLSTFLATFTYGVDKPKSFFQATQRQPYHLSIGAVLFDGKGRIACHHFDDIFGYKDVYILMRESMENDETPLATLHRGLKEEFGATAKPVAFLGSLSGYLPDSNLSFDKTTLYIACQVIEWNPENRDVDDPEGKSRIEWMEPSELISLMEQQGIRFSHRADVDESIIIKRALPCIKELLQKKTEYNINPAMTPIPISSESVTVERGTSKTVPRQAQRTSNPALNA